MGGKSYDGSLIYDTEIDTSGFEKGSDQIQKKADETGNTIKRKSKETSDEVKKNTKETFDDFEKKSKDTEEKTKQRSKRTTEEIQKSAQDTRDTLDGLNKTAKAVLLTAASVGAGILAMGISYNSQMENYKTSFEVMTGSADKAADAVERLKKMGAATPFELPQLAETTQLLMNYGFTVDEAIDRMSMLGDISQGNADKLGRIAMAYGQMSSAGKVALEDVKQMIEAGFNPLQEISQTTGESMASLYNRISKGTIGVDEITASMQRATSEGGKYFQSMEKQSKTLQGQWSTLKDNVAALTGQMAEDISEKLTTTVLPDLIDMVEKLSEMWEDGSLQNAIGDVVTAVAAFGTAIAAVNLIMFANDIMNIVKKTKDFTAVTKAGEAAQKLMNSTLMKNPYVLVAAALATLIVSMSTYAATHKTAADEIIESYENTIASIDKNYAREIAQAEMTSKTINDLKGELYSLEGQIKSGTLSENEAIIAREKFNEKAAQLEEILPEITQYLYSETNEINIQADAVENLANSYSKLMVAKATANAMQSKLEESIATRIEAKKTLDATPKSNYSGYIAPFWEYDWVNMIMYPSSSLPEVYNPAWSTAQKTYQTALSDEEYYTKLAEDAQKEYETLYKELFPNGSGGGAGVRGGSRSSSRSGSGGSRSSIDEDPETIRKKELQAIKDFYALGEISSEEYYKQLEIHRDKYFKHGTIEWHKFNQEIGSERLVGIKNLYALGTLSDEEYYTQLEAHRDKYFKKGTVEWQNFNEEIGKEKLAALKNQYEMGEISELEYYKTLELYRDTYFAENTDSWRRHTQEISDFNKKTVENFVDLLADAQNEANTMLDNLAEKQQSIANGFRSDKSPVEYGTINGEKYVNLANYDKENNKLNLYNQLLDDLFTKRPDLPNSVLSELQGMDIDQGIKYVEALLRATDTQWDSFLKSRRLEKENAEKISSRLMSGEFDEAKKLLEEKFGQVPKDFFGIGADSAEYFGEGFITELGTIMQTVRNQINAELSSLSAGAIAFNSAGGDSSSVVNNNTNNATYIIGSQKETVTEQLNAATRWDTLNKMRDMQ